MITKELFSSPRFSASLPTSEFIVRPLLFTCPYVSLTCFMTLLSLHATSYLQIILFITSYAPEHESLAIDQSPCLLSSLHAILFYVVGNML